MYKVARVLRSVGKKSEVILARQFVTVGDKVPINYVKDKPAVVIKEDSEYPEWISELSGRLPGKTLILRKAKEVGIENLTVDELRRGKRAITLEKIKNNNAASKA